MNIGITLYNVREEIVKDFNGTLTQLAEMGYRGVELSGVPLKEYNAQEVKSQLDALGLVPVCTHIKYKEENTFDPFYIDFGHAIGMDYVMVGNIRQVPHESADDFKRIAEHLNLTARQYKEHGIRFGYHNHDFEFAVFDGKYGMDILMESMDPSLITFQPDIYWIMKSGVPIASYLKKMAGRVPTVHIKDSYDGPERKTFTEIGEGIIDFKEIFDTQAETGTEWYIVEQDFGNKPTLESARISSENLRKMGVLR